MKYVVLLAAAYAAGQLRFPSDGALPVDDDEAQKLIDAGVATDVTADFAEAAEPVEPTPAPIPETAPASEPQTTAESKPAARRRSAPQE